LHIGVIKTCIDIELIIIGNERMYLVNNIDSMPNEVTTFAISEESFGGINIDVPRASSKNTA
jgi:hypothetical protein